MSIQKEKTDFLTRGEFRSTDKIPFKEIHAITSELVELQEQLDLQMNTLMNVYRDGITGKMLGFELVNIEPHGIDCKHKDKNLFLEVKSIDWNDKYKFNHSISFSNTTIEKTNAFRNKKLFLAVSVWDGANDLMFILFGQSWKIGVKLNRVLKKQLTANKKNRQHFTLMRLVTEFGFKIIPINKSRQSIIKMFSAGKIQDVQIIENSFIDHSEFCTDGIRIRKRGMCDNDLEWFHTGNFLSTNDPKFLQLSSTIAKIGIIQKEFDLKYTDSIFNIYHDGIVGKLLGFNLINIGGGGPDCKNNNDLFLEVKSIQWNDLGLSNQVSFSDMTIEKAKAFENKNLLIAISLWKNTNDLMFMVVGQNSKLSERFIEHIKKAGVPSKTINISISTLVRVYNFKVVPISISKEDTLQMLKTKHPSIFPSNELDDNVINLDVFNLQQCSSDIECKFPKIDAFIGDTIVERISIKDIKNEMYEALDIIGKDICLLYTLLYELSRKQNGYVEISTREISKRLNWERRHVQVMIKYVEGLGLIKKMYSGTHAIAAIYYVSNIETFRRRVFI